MPKKEKMKIRKLTTKECERLQGFPDDWTKHGIDEKGNQVEMSDTQRYKMCGNALTVNVAREIIQRLFNL
jgi:DNA (cytosine-5)-methyltransferase 1